MPSPTEGSVEAIRCSAATPTRPDNELRLPHPTERPDSFATIFLRVSGSNLELCGSIETTPMPSAKAVVPKLPVSESFRTQTTLPVVNMPNPNWGPLESLPTPGIGCHSE